MIIEGLLTTINADGTVNLAPMGPIVDEDWRRLLFRPFQTSQTFANLQRTGRGVFHVTDDVEMLARAAVGQPEPMPEMHRTDDGAGWIVAGACRWYVVNVLSIDDRQPRAEIETGVLDMGRLRDFLGFNRAKHAVIEAAILATRLKLLPAAEIQAELVRLAIIVQKTAGSQEQRAWEFIRGYIATELTRLSSQ